MDALSPNQKILISALVGFVIGAGTVLVWNISRGEPETTTVTPSTSQTVMEDKANVAVEATSPTQVATVVAAAVGNNNISAPDQTAGAFVQIETLTLNEAGWVAIHEDNNGELSNILGAAWFPRGTSLGSVELLRNTLPGGTYHAVLYMDNGNKAFELNVDALLVDENNSPIQDTFRAVTVAE